MRTQYCRQHIKKTAQECDLGDDIVAEVEKVDKFCGSNPAFADCATRPVYRLISEQDVNVRNKAILFAENALNEVTPTGGKVRDRLTEPEIIVILRKARRELHGESEKPKNVQKPAENVEKRSHAFDGMHDGQPAEPPKVLSSQMDKTAANRADMAEAAKNQPPVITDNTPVVSQDTDQFFMTGGGAEGLAMAHKWTTEVCKSGRCPDGKCHTKKEQQRGLVCLLWNQQVDQLSMCHIIEKRKRELMANPGFQTAAAMAKLDMAVPIKPAGIRVIKTPLTTEELKACADDLIERSGFFTQKEVGLVDDLVRAGHEGIHSRADFIKVSCNWFLTSAEGE